MMKAAEKNGRMEGEKKIASFSMFFNSLVRSIGHFIGKDSLLIVLIQRKLGRKNSRRKTHFKKFLKMFF
jgi:hypothetical protein